MSTIAPARHQRLDRPLPQHKQGGPPMPQNGPPRMSAALIRGAQQFTELFDKRTAALKMDYEEQIRILTVQRDELLAASQAQTLQIPIGAADRSELEALRAERLVLLQERADREQERTQWNEERVIMQTERVRWNEEREAEHARWREERAVNDSELARWKEDTLRLTQERDSILAGREQCRQEHKDLEDELGCVRHELQVAKAGYNTLQGQLALRDARVMALETRVGELEAGPQTKASAPVHNNADGVEDQQDPFSSLSFIQSPTHSTTLATVSAESTMLSLNSPSLGPVSVPIRMQLDEVAAEPSAVSNITSRLSCPLSPMKLTIAESVQSDDLMPELFTPVTQPGSARSSVSATATTSTRRLVVRLPPSVGKSRKSLKPTPPRFTEEEMRNIVHVPRRPESDEVETR